MQHHSPIPFTEFFLYCPPGLDPSASEVAGLSPNMLPCAAPRFFADALAKRDLGFALLNKSVFCSMNEQTPMMYYSLPNLLVAIGAQLGCARAHDVVGGGDV